MKYNQFIFDSYTFDRTSGVLELHYGMDDALQFTEKYTFDFEFADYDEDVLDQALQLLFFTAGASYYKMYIPPEIVVKAGHIDQQLADFLSKTYQRGMGEFWYVNNLDPRTPVTFPTTTEKIETKGYAGSGPITSIGGGKDSLAAIEILRTKFPELITWSVNHRPQLTPLVERVGLQHQWVERQWDSQIAVLNQQDALNGHIPISAVFAIVGTCVAILSGRQDVIVANEQSANEPTLTYRGVEINHQYSKSQEFEDDYQALLQHLFGDGIRYYSFFRPLSEVKIGEIFARLAFDKYKDVFSSCNRAYVHGSNHMSWCGECPKCAFIFLILTPFVERDALEKLWGGKNLLLDPSLEPMYRKLLGIEGDKPLECVGEVKESRAAMRIAQEQYPELATKYQFDIPDGYDYKNLGLHSMPDGMYQLLTANL